MVNNCCWLLPPLLSNASCPKPRNFAQRQSHGYVSIEESRTGHHELAFTQNDLAGIAGRPREKQGLNCTLRFRFIMVSWCLWKLLLAIRTGDRCDNILIGLWMLWWFMLPWEVYIFNTVGKYHHDYGWCMIESSQVMLLPNYGHMHLPYHYNVWLLA